MANEICPECRGKAINNGTEIYCETCGLVIEHPIDHEGESYEGKEGQIVKPCGPPHKWIDPSSGTYSMVGNAREFKAWKNKRFRMFSR